MEIGKLYVVATPIGNLKDITLRAIETLQSVDYIACEDTRKTGILLKAIGVTQRPSLISYYEQNELGRVPNILNLLINGRDVALVSDGGTPAISDPGFPLLRECVKNKIEIVSIPGPSAVISALASSGLPTDKFLFMGFLPRKEGNKKKMLESVRVANSKLESTVVIYEAPHRIVKTLVSMMSVFGDINVSLFRELTKIHEEKVSDKLSNLIAKYENREPKGEFVILFTLKPEFQD